MTDMTSPGFHASRVINHPAIWQMNFLDPRGLSSFSRSREIRFQADVIEQLWLTGLLRADYILSSRKLDMKGLELLKRDEAGWTYADCRNIDQREEGWGKYAELPNEASRNYTNVSSIQVFCPLSSSQSVSY